MGVAADDVVGQARERHEALEPGALLSAHHVQELRREH